MEQKATITLETKTNDAKGRPLPVPLTTLVIAGELLPDNPMVHHVLDALLDKEDPPTVEVKFGNLRNVLSYSVTFSHRKDVLAEAREEHRLTVKAADHNMGVEQMRELEAREKKAKADAEEEAKKAAAKKE